MKSILAAALNAVALGTFALSTFALAAFALPAVAASPVTLDATVAPGGLLLSGTAVRVTYNAELGGTYYVYFRRSVEACAAVGSVTGTGSSPTEAPAFLTTGATQNTPTAIAVQVRDVAGKLVQRGFSLLVTCG